MVLAIALTSGQTLKQCELHRIYQSVEYRIDGVTILQERFVMKVIIHLFILINLLRRGVALLEGQEGERGWGETISKYMFLFYCLRST